MTECRFFSSLIQRAAKLAKRKGGGSMSLLMVGAGMPARGEAPLPPTTAQYKHLSEEQRQKLKAALEAAQQDVRLSQPEGCLRVEVRLSLHMQSPNAAAFLRLCSPSHALIAKVDAQDSPCARMLHQALAARVQRANAKEELSSIEEVDVSQVIEELMSIADGQVVLQRDSATGAVGVNPQASISRIGSRAYPPALAELAIDLRFELAQVTLTFMMPIMASCKS